MAGLFDTNSAERFSRTLAEHLRIYFLSKILQNFEAQKLEKRVDEQF